MWRGLALREEHARALPTQQAAIAGVHGNDADGEKRGGRISVNLGVGVAVHYRTCRWVG